MIADTHLPRARRRLPEPCVARLAAAELILHVGDFVASSVLAEIESLGPPVAAVCGNADEHALRSRLPAARTIETGGARIALVHDAGRAAGRLERLRARFPDVHAVVFGHSHIPLHELRDGFQIFNPGSPTDRRREPRHTMGIAEVSAGRLRFEHVVLD